MGELKILKLANSELISSSDSIFVPVNIVDFFHCVIMSFKDKILFWIIYIQLKSNQRSLLVEFNVINVAIIIIDLIINSLTQKITLNTL